MPKITFREKLNGNYGFVITSGMVIFIIAIIGFLFNFTTRLDARIDERATNCIQKETQQMKEDISCIKTDTYWMKETLKEINEKLE